MPALSEVPLTPRATSDSRATKRVTHPKTVRSVDASLAALSSPATVQRSVLRRDGSLPRRVTSSAQTAEQTSALSSTKTDTRVVPVSTAARSVAAGPTLPRPALPPEQLPRLLSPRPDLLVAFWPDPDPKPFLICNIRGLPGSPLRPLALSYMLDRLTREKVFPDALAPFQHLPSSIQHGFDIGLPTTQPSRTVNPGVNYNLNQDQRTAVAAELETEEQFGRVSGLLTAHQVDPFLDGRFQASRANAVPSRRVVSASTWIAHSKHRIGERKDCSTSPSVQVAIVDGHHESVSAGHSSIVIGLSRLQKVLSHFPNS